MKSVILNGLMKSGKVDRQTALGRAWDDATEKLCAAEDAITEKLKDQPNVLALFLSFQKAYDDLLTAECDYLYKEAFRYGFFLAAELYDDRSDG